MRRRCGSATAWGLLAALILSGCVETPSVVVIEDNALERITLAHDPSAGRGHNHPYRISPEDMARVLKGVMVKDRNAIIGFGIMKDRQGTPAFPSTLIARLAPHLANALGRASAGDLVTFYVTKSESARGPLVTSGGLLVRDHFMYFMLANLRTPPSETSNDFSFAMELDNRDAPLEPIGRFRFTVEFTPAEAWVPSARANQQAGYKPYMDESKLVVIDLARLSGPPTQPPPP
jgi:hypothetical protein